MRFFLLALPVFLLAACSGPRETETTGAFDARAWLAEARTTGADTMTTLPSYDDPRVARMRALADPLDAAVGWRLACDTFRDPDTGVVIVDSSGDASRSWPRATFFIRDFGRDEALVAVTCDYGAYQGYYAIARLHGRDASLLTTPVFGPSGTISDRRTSQFSTLVAVNPAARTFTTFALARGLGDCGERATYLVEGDAADPSQIRARDCDSPEPHTTSESWPVVFPAR